VRKATGDPGRPAGARDAGGGRIAWDRKALCGNGLTLSGVTPLRARAGKFKLTIPPR
jgi:hypothetical protein